MGKFVKALTTLGVMAFTTACLAMTASAADASAQGDTLLRDYGATQSHFTIGIDPMLFSSTTRDAALGYPQKAIGMNAGLGIEYRKYITAVPASAVKAVADEIIAGNPGISDTELRERVKNALNRKLFTYWGFDTIGLIIPGLEYGATYSFADANGTGPEINFGLWSNLAWLMIPAPYVGFSFSF